MEEWLLQERMEKQCSISIKKHLSLLGPDEDSEYFYVILLLKSFKITKIKQQNIAFLFYSKFLQYNFKEKYYKF